MSEEKKPFTVTDRRHFTPDGQARDEVVESEHPAAPAGDPTMPVREPAVPVREPGASAQDTVAPARVPAGPESHVSHPAPGSPRDAEALDFAGFLLSLAAQGSHLLGLGPGGDQEADVAGARQIISILEMLEDKTKGRRTPEEEKVLKALLYELRMGYLERTGAGGS